MRRPGERQRRIVILVLAVLAFGIAYYGGNRFKEDEQPAINGILLRPAPPVPEFELTDQRGEVFSNRQLADHWSLLLLDPTAAPSARRFLARIHNRLALSPELQRQVHFIHIPRNIDTDFTSADFGGGFFTLQGDSSETGETFSRFGVDQQPSGLTLYLAGPDARLHAMFTGNQDAATIAADLTSLINKPHN